MQQNQQQIFALPSTQTSLALKNPLAHLVTALPYIDDQLDTSNEPIDKEEQIRYKLQAQELVKQEMRRMPKEDYLKSLPMPQTQILDQSELFQSEMIRIDQQEQLEPLDLAQYSIPTYPLEDIKETSKLKTVIDKIKTVYQHNSMRQLNLELLQKYGPDAYKSHIQKLIKIKESIQEESTKLKVQADEINTRRKFDQQNSLADLQGYIDKIKLMQVRNVELERHTLELENEVKDMRKKKMKLN